MPAKYWRFEGGYQDAPEPAPDPTACQQIMAGWNCVSNYQPWGCGPWGYPGWSPPAQFVPGPIYINGLQSPPPPYGVISPPPPDGDPNLRPAPPEDGKKEDKKSKEKKENVYAPPKMPDGCNYMFDKEHTTLHIFNKTHAVWEDKYKKEPKKFKMFKVSVNFSVKMVIENVLRKAGDDCKGWAATEAVELGGGNWAKGSTIEYDSDKSKGTLKDMAWTTKRGDKLPPVWLVVHKV